MPVRREVQKGRLRGIKSQSEEPTMENRDKHWPCLGISPRLRPASPSCHCLLWADPSGSMGQGGWCHVPGWGLTGPLFPPFTKKGWPGTPRSHGSGHGVGALRCRWPHEDRAAIFALYLRGGNTPREEEPPDRSPEGVHSTNTQGIVLQARDPAPLHAQMQSTWPEPVPSLNGNNVSSAPRWGRLS